MILCDKNGNILLAVEKEMFPLEFKEETPLNFTRHVYAKYATLKVNGVEKEVPRSLNIGA